jgi:hypothetical protein
MMKKKEIKQLKDWDGKGAKIMTKKILCLGLMALPFSGRLNTDRPKRRR